MGVIRQKTIVMKFGGTSVQDSESIGNIINIIQKTKANKIVVVSAIAKATNSLEEIARLSSQKKITKAKAVLDLLVKRHQQIINGLVQNKKFYKAANNKIKDYRNKLVELITGVSIISELSLRTLDSFRVFGELMSSTVIYYAIKNLGINVELIDSRNIIKTDNEFSRAYPDFDITQINFDSKVMPLLKKKKIVLAQGFIASTEDGVSTTMGRESSDFSAAIYGALCNADEIQIWTDVDGVLTADPNVIKNAFKLAEISFQEMEELSNFGAKVLHKNSIKPALKKNIPLRVLNSKNTSSDGTMISSRLKYHNLVKSITFKKNIIVLRLKPKEGLNQYVFWEMMFNILSKHKPQVDIMVSSNNAIIIVIAENNYTKIHYDDLKNEFNDISEYAFIKDKVLITIVGSDLNKIDDFEKRIFMSCPGIRAESIVFGFNQHSFSFLLDNKHFETTLRNLHSEFFENHKKKTKLFQKTSAHIN